MPLSDYAIRASKPAEKRQRKNDGGGLYLEVSPAGGKLLRFKHRVWRKGEAARARRLPGRELGGRARD